MMLNVIQYLHENNYERIQGKIKADKLDWDGSEYPQRVPIEAFYDVFWFSVHKIKRKVDPKEVECLKDIQQRIEHLMKKREKEIEDWAVSGIDYYRDGNLEDGTWWVARDGSYDIELGQLYYVSDYGWSINDSWKPIKEKSER